MKVSLYHLTSALVASTLLFTDTRAHAAGGDLLWEDHFDLAARQDVAQAVAAGDGRVVAAGFAQNAAGDKDFLVRCYDAETGALLWKDVVDVAGRDDVAASVAVYDDRVIVAGTAIAATGGTRLLLRVYVAQTGELAWEDRPASAVVGGLAAHHSRVVVAGTSADAAGNPRLAVRAYILESGVLDWEDNPPPPSGFVRFIGPSVGGSGRGVAVHGQRVFVAGTVETGPFLNPRCIVRAYITRNGKLDWESVADGLRCQAKAIATDGNNVVLAALGNIGLDDFQALGLDAETGQFLWANRTFVGTGFDNEAIAADIERHVAYVGGWVRRVPLERSNQEALVVRAYDTQTGVIYWEDQYPGPGADPFVDRCLCQAHDLTVDKGRVFAVGSAHGFGAARWIVRSYDVEVGNLIWSDDFAPVGGVGSATPDLFHGARAIAVDGGRVFVAGSGFNADGNEDFIVRAYDAK
jgi:outer membrane protein assembly factor BamB